jgi:predicted DNA-binding transcriptional regulator YafY
MPTITEMPRGERIANILILLVRNRRRKYCIRDILDLLNEEEPVIHRNVQRDCKSLVDRHPDIVGTEFRNGKLYYFIQPDMRDKLNLPIHRNGVLALFMLKRLQSFLARDNANLKAIDEVLAELGSNDDYELFYDLDEQLSQSSITLGSQPAFGLDTAMIGDLLTALVQHRILEISYYRANDDEPVARTICPVRLVLFNAELYFLCISPMHKDRDYYIKLCRISTAKLTDQKFEVSKQRLVHINARLQKSFGILDEDLPKPEKVEIRFPGYFLRTLTERQFHHTQKIRKCADGGCMLTMTVPVSHELVKWVLGWSDCGEVVRPKTLREKLRCIGTELSKRYCRK